MELEMDKDDDLLMSEDGLDSEPTEGRGRDNKAEPTEKRKTKREKKAKKARGSIMVESEKSG